MASLNAMDRGHTLKNISEQFLDFSKAFAYMPNQMAKLDDYETKIGKLEKIRDSLSNSLADSSRKKDIEDRIQAYIKEEEALNKVSWVYNELMTVVEAFTSILQVGKEVVSGFIDGLKPIFNVVYDYVIEPIIALVGSISAFITAINNALVKSGVIKDSLSGFGNLIAKLITPALDVICGIIENITAAVDDLTYSIENGTSPIPGIIEGIKSALEGFFGFFSKAADGFSFGGIFNSIKTAFTKFLEFISPVTSKVKEILGKLFNDLKISLQNLSFNDVLAGVGTGGLITFLGSLKGVLDKIKGMFSKGGAKETAVGIKGFFDQIKEGITGLMDSVKETANVTALLEAAGAVVIISLAISRLSTIPKDDIAKALGAITEVFLELFGFMFLFTKINDGSFKNFDKVGAGLLKLSAGIYIIGRAVTELAAIDDPTKLRNAIIAIGAVLLELVGFERFTKKSTGFKSDGIIKMAVGLFLIAKAIQPLAQMEVEDLKKGIISMGAILLELSVFQSILNKTGGTKGAVGMGAGMILIATSMLIFAKAISAIGSTNVDVVNAGLGTLASVLAGLTVALFVLKDVPVLGIASGMLILSVALGAISGMIALLGRAKWQTLAKGVGAIVTVVWGLGLAMKSMSKAGAGGLFAAAGSMVVMAAALTLLTVPLVVLGQLSWDSIAKGLAAFAGSLVIMGVAGSLLGGLAPVLLSLAGACALFGVGLVAMGAGLLLISASLPAAVTSIMASITAFIVGLGAAISALALTLAGSAAAITESIVILGKAIIDAVVQLVPPLVDGVLYLIQALLISLATYGPGIITAFVDIIIGLLGAIEQKLPDLIDAGASLAISFIGGIAQGIIDHTDEAMVAMESLVNSLVYFALATLQELASQIPFVGDDIAGALEGVKNSVKEKVDSAEIEEAGKAGGDRLDRGLNSKKNDIRNTGTALSEEGISGVLSKDREWGTAGTDLATLFGDKVFHEGGFVNSAGVHLGEEGSDGIDSTQGQWTDSGNYTVDGLYGSLTSQYNLDRVFNAGATLGGSANAGYNSALMINSPSKKMMWSAEMTIEGLVKGFGNFGYRVARSGAKLGEGVIDAISTTLSTINSVMDENDFSPVISPVLDLTNVEQGAGRLDTLLASRRVGVTASAFGSRFADTATAAAASGSSIVIQNLTVNGTENMDVNELSDAVIDKLNRQIASENSRWAY
jgi:phage-related protein